MTAISEPAVDLGALPAMDVASRATRLGPLLADAGVDALSLVTHLPNVRYLTGFAPAVRRCSSSPTTPLVFTSDGRYRTRSGRAARRRGGRRAQIEIGATVAPAWRRRARRRALDRRRVGPRSARGHVGATASARGRTRRSRARSHRRSRRTAPADQGTCRGRAHPRRVFHRRRCPRHAPPSPRRTTPRSATCVGASKSRDATPRCRSGNSFDPIVASGPNAAKPHARPSARQVEPGELVVIDFGCVVDGYCSDMTRTVSVGDPGPEARRVWDVVRDSQSAGRDAVRAGVDVARPSIAPAATSSAAAGWADLVRARHRSWRGSGDPTRSPEWPRKVPVIPWNPVFGRHGRARRVSPSGVGGVRIEDTVVVTPDGSDPLTAFPKHLII